MTNSRTKGSRNERSVAKILQEKKSKETTIQRKFSLTSKEPNGLVLIKEIIQESLDKVKCENCEVSYIAAGKYLIKVKTKNLKEADQNLDKIEENIENLSKQKKCAYTEIKA